MGSLKLTTASSGSVILSPANTASDVTITVPASTATMAINGPAFSAYASVSQTGIANTTYTKINFDTEIFDTNNNFASSRFTPTVAGYYQVFGATTVGSTTTSHGLATILYKNGSAIFTGVTSNANASLYPLSVVTGTVYMNGTTDYLEIYVYGSFGGTFSNVQGATNTYFNGAMVRAA